MSAPLAQAPTHPAVVKPSAVTVLVTYTNTFQLYMPTGWQLHISLAVTGATVNNVTTTISVEVQNGATSAVLNNVSLFNELSAGNTTAFNMTVNSTNLGAPANGFQAKFTTWVNVSGTWGAAQQSVYIIVNAAHGGFVSPTPNVGVGIGNVTIVVKYGGDFLNGANVTVYSGTTVVFVSPTFEVGAGNHTVAALAPWVVGTPGTYKAVLTVTTQYGSAQFPQWVNVTSTGGTVYVNHTSYQNTTLPFGLTAGTMGALLLVVGLIIGMLVALALGRMMWGSSRPAPAQAWSAKAANECSICHQTFPTEDALKAHQKEAHGM